MLCSEMNFGAEVSEEKNETQQNGRRYQAVRVYTRSYARTLTNHLR